jgi:hypothetical protein
MDPRQAQIRERAGLEESRLNQDFIEALRSYSTPVLLVLAIAAGGYVALTKYRKAQIEKLESAFTEFEAANSSTAPSPESLKRVAEDHGKVGAVAVLAKLRAADAYMDSVRSGLRPGAKVTSTGALEKPEDAITDEERKTFLASAEALYAEVAQRTANNTPQLPLRVGAIFGLAAVAESRQDYDGAKAKYDEVVRVSEHTPFKMHAEVAKARIAKLDELKNLPKLYSEAELPADPTAPKIDLNPIVPEIMPTPIQPEPAGPAPAPAGPPAPTPQTPAPAEAPAPTEPAPSAPPK